MHLTDQEFEKLQKLACIEFKGEEKNNFLDKLDSVIDFLGKLKDLPVGDIDLEQDEQNYKLLIPKKGVEEYEDAKGLLKNVEHEVINDSIAIRFSVG